VRVRERQLGLCESHTVLQLILAILDGIPIESRFRHWNITLVPYKKPYNYMAKDPAAAIPKQHASNMAIMTEHPERANFK
jgi:hypothetical protein